MPLDFTDLVPDDDNGRPLNFRQMQRQGYPMAPAGAGEPGGDPALMKEPPQKEPTQTAPTPATSGPKGVSFDDLIPQKDALSFDDLIPSQAQRMENAGQGAPEIAAEQGMIPEPTQSAPALREAAGRIAGEAKAGFDESPPVLTQEAQDWLDKTGLGGITRTAGGLLALSNAALKGLQQTVTELGATTGFDRLARDVNAYIESVGMTGAPHMGHVPLGEIAEHAAGRAAEGLAAAREHLGTATEAGEAGAIPGPAPGAQVSPEAIPTVTVTAHAPTPTTPEPPADIHAQVKALADPNNPKDAVFIAPGTEVPAAPEHAEVVQRPEGTLLTDNPAKATAFRDAPAVDDAMLAQLLEYPETKEQAVASGEPAVVQGVNHAGDVVAESLASPEGVPAAEAAAASQAPDVRVVSPEQAQARRADATPTLNAMAAEARARAEVPQEVPESSPPETPVADVPESAVEPPASTANPYQSIPKEPQRISSFLKSIGGVQDDGGDIRSSLGGAKYRPGLINKNGLPLDDAALRAWEAGYFPDLGDDRPSINDLRDALHDDLNGRPRYSFQDDIAVANYTRAIEHNNEIDQLAATHGIDTTGKTAQQIFDEAAIQPLGQVSRDIQASSEAHDTAYQQAQDATREWWDGQSDEAWNPGDFYGENQNRSLEDLERERKQEETAVAAQQFAGRNEEPQSAGPNQADVQGGGGPRADSAGPAGRPAPEGSQDLLGNPIRQTSERVAEPTIRNDPNQIGLAGMEPSAVQAQAARDQAGGLRVGAEQKPANEGIFAPDTSGQGTLYSFPGMLADPAVWRKTFGPLAPALRAIREATGRVTQSIADGLAPMQGGTKRAQSFAADFANSLRQVVYRYGEIDREIEKHFTPSQRDAMGRALDAQSVFEQQLRDVPVEQQAAAREAFDAGKSGIAGLNEKQTQVVHALDAISQDVWRRMQQRGLVDPNAKPLPYYFPRQIVMWSEAEGFKRTEGKGGSGRGIDARGLNLTTTGPMRREHLTPEETEAAAKAKLGVGATLLRDIRSLPARLAYAERSIAGVDLMDKIKEVGRLTGVDLVRQGDIPGLLDPSDYFTMSDHPSFRRWSGSGWQPIHVAKEFEGPLKAVLTKPTGAWYRAAQNLKGGVMSAIMFSPFIHLAVELGRSFPVMAMHPVLTLRALRDASTLRRDLNYMDQAIKDGIAPLGHTAGWSVDPVSLADQANVEGRNRYLRAIGGLRDATANAAGTAVSPLGARASEFMHDLVQHPHQTLLWDNVFNLQVGLYDSLKRVWSTEYSPEVAGTMAAHIANRYAGALPAEHLSKAANMAANMLLFSRSFTLGNLGVMKDMLSGAPSHVIARIEQMAGPDVAKSAQSALRRKAISAFVMDIGLFYMANGLLQAGLQAVRQGVGATEQDLTDKAMSALDSVSHGNLLSIFGVLPQHWNEPGKQGRVYAGTDSQGTGVYLRLPPGKVGEEFVGWWTHPGTMVMDKLSPLVRPIVELAIGHDSMGRALLPPNPQTIGDYVESAGDIVKHIAGNLGPTAFIQGAHEMWQQWVQGKTTKADPYVSALKVFGPLTGLAQISQGFPGGPASGEVHAQSERQKYELQKAMPGIRDKIRSGDSSGAAEDMTALGVPTRLQKYYIQQTEQPSTSKAQMQKFRATASPEARERFERQRAE